MKYWFVFLCGWVLGIPLIGFGLSNSEYPDNLNLVSAILAHLMNLINPLLYGIFWYKWFVADGQVAPQKGLDTEFEVQDAYGSSVPYALPAPWNTPVTPVQYPTYTVPHLFTHMMRLLPTQRTVVRCPLLQTHRCIEQMPKLHFASNLFCLF